MTLRDAEATDIFGRSLAAAMVMHLDALRAAGFQINLAGDLGAGKTALVRAILRALGITGAVKSPTFALLEPYTVSSLDFYHFDFYRLKEPKEFGNTGFRELFGPGRICVVEWPERAGPRIPEDHLPIDIDYSADDPHRRVLLAG